MLLPLSHGKTELIEVFRITDPVRHLSSDDLAGDAVAIWEGDLAVLPCEVGDAACGWLALQRGVSAVVIVGVQP
ncbi:hypothetical protein ACWC2M_40120, partial [Streptomyces sp. NPDC001761]